MVNYEQLTDGMIQAPFHINEKLEDTVKMSGEDFAVFKADIKSTGLKEPIEVMRETISTENHPEGELVKTVVDGHHRLKALRAIKTGKPDCSDKDYEIPFKVLGITTLQEALDYSYKVNTLRKDYNTYQRVTRALEIYGKSFSDKEVAVKANVDNGNLSKIKKLNNMLDKLSDKVVAYNNPEKASFYRNGLNSGKIGYTEALGELTNAENIDNIIAVVDNPNGEVAKKIGKDNAKKFKKELEETFATAKYEKRFILKDSTPSSKEVSCSKCKGKGLVKESKVASESPFNALQKMIDQHIHPELYAPVEESPYAIAAQKVSDVVDPLAVKFPEEVKVFMVTTESGFLECGDYIKAQAGSGSLYAIAPR